MIRASTSLHRGASRLPWIEPGGVLKPHWTHKNPVQTGIGEEIVGALYDYTGTAVATVTVAQNAFSIGFGQQYTPTGGAAFQKTRWHTNLRFSGQLPAPDQFTVQALSITLDPRTTPSDMAKFLFQMLITFRIGSNDKRYLELQPLFVPGAGGVFVGGTPANSAYVTANGWPSAQNTYRLGETEQDGAELIELGNTFLVEEDPTKCDLGAFTSDTGNANPPSTVGLRVFYHLWGSQTRGV